MLTISNIIGVVSDWNGCYRMIFDDGSDIGKELIITAEQHAALSGKSWLEPYLIQHDGSKLISAERYIEEPIKRDWDELLTADKPFRCAWCRKPTATTTNALCDDCHKDDVFERSFQEERERETKELMQISREGAA